MVGYRLSPAVHVGPSYRNNLALQHTMRVRDPTQQRPANLRPRDHMIYLAYQAQSDVMQPVRALARALAGAVKRPLPGLWDNVMVRNLGAAYEMIAHSALTHTRPPYGIDSVQVGGREVAVREEAAHVTPFGTLLHFRKDTDIAQPRILLIAPLSG